MDMLFKKTCYLLMMKAVPFLSIMWLPTLGANIYFYTQIVSLEDNVRVDVVVICVHMFLCSECGNKD